MRAAARQREAERRARRRARRQALTGWLPRPRLQPGVLAARRRAELTATFGLLLLLNVLVWLVRPDWAARLGALVVSLRRVPGRTAHDAEPMTRSVVVTGVPGAGKTTLALGAGRAARGVPCRRSTRSRRSSPSTPADTPRTWLRYDAEQELVPPADAFAGEAVLDIWVAPRRDTERVGGLLGAVVGRTWSRCAARCRPTSPSSGTPPEPGRGRTCRPTARRSRGSATRPSPSRAARGAPHRRGRHDAAGADRRRGPPARRDAARRRVRRR